jgi:DNA-binding XRE family transcriptional regulator
MYMGNDRAFVAFGDGFHCLVPLSRIIPGEISEQPLSLDTIRASEDGDSLEVSSRSGRTIDVDSSAIRACLASDFAKKLHERNSKTRLEVGARLRALRLAAKKSQVALAKTTGISQEVISRIEKGKQTPRLQTLERLAAALGMSVPDLLTDPHAQRAS